MRHRTIHIYSDPKRLRQFAAWLIAFGVAAALFVLPAAAAPRAEQTGNPPAQTTSYVSIRVARPAAAESGQEPATLIVGRTGSTAAPLDVAYSSFGSATAGEDYVALPGNITIPAGANSTTFSVEPIDDSAKEGPEMVVISLDMASDYAIAAPASATIWIADDDTPGQVVSFYVGDSNAAEPGPDVGDFTIARNGSTAAPLTVYFTTGGTATPGADYIALPAHATIPAGSASVSLKVTPINDAIVEATEIVVLSFRSDAAYTMSTPASATVAIMDNDSVPAGAPEYRVFVPLITRGA
ncbi:MAG TPA: Calx-beta domain-containing protein [Roseiflexaceae bacterium]|nr:Calx-beta domain-containing protein [Roseiflexaceae bacterium]